MYISVNTMIHVNDVIMIMNLLAKLLLTKTTNDNMPIVKIIMVSF